jgi:hypothetical protein
MEISTTIVGISTTEDTEDAADQAFPEKGFFLRVLRGN